MPELVKKAAVWLGLVTDDRYDDKESDEYSESVYVDTEMPQAIAERSEVIQLPHHAADASSSHISEKAAQTADLARIVSVRPHAFNEARVVGENFRAGMPVIMNLSDMDDADARRLVDFAAGLIFGLHGSIERVTNKVFLLSPQNVSVTAEDKERLASPTFFNQS